MKATPTGYSFIIKTTGEEADRDAAAVLSGRNEDIGTTGRYFASARLGGGFQKLLRFTLALSRMRTADKSERLACCSSLLDQ
jgi:hypothetical protein